MVHSPNINKSIHIFYPTSNSGQATDQELIAYFDEIGEQIASQIKPETVLVLGGSNHLLVSALHQRNIEAYGALEPGFSQDNLPEDIRSFYVVESLSRPFTNIYELIVCLEVFPLLSLEEARRACKRICASSTGILFSATPYGVRNRENLTVQPPGYWAEMFAAQGFFSDINFSGTFVSPWAFYYCKVAVTSQALLAAYQQRIWELEQEVRARQEHQIEQRKELALKEMQLYQAQQQIAFKVEENEAILNSRSWRIMRRFQNIRLKFFPIGSRQEERVLSFVGWLRLWRREGARSFLLRVYDTVSWKVKVAALRFRSNGRFSGRSAHIETIPPRSQSSPHTTNIDIVICVHNALEDVQRCLNSVMLNSTEPYSLILVDDGSDLPTQQLLLQFVSEHNATLIRNEQAGGYTRAANQGMKATKGDLVVLLNSDTIVTPGWLDRMTSCIKSDTKIGIVGPLSNTASWQSIPEIESNGDWASNPLPLGVTPQKMAELVDKYSGYLFSSLPFLNGFCLLIRREVINQIGYFDEES